jgi:hypothetical protein
MNITLVLAQVLGITFAVLGLSMLFNKNNTILAVEEMVQSKSFMWIGGLIALMIGAVIIALNNVWSSNLHLLISLIGWLALIKGAFLLFLPNSAASFYRKVNKGNIFVLAGLVVFILGLLLLYKGFV